MKPQMQTARGLKPSRYGCSLDAGMCSGRRERYSGGRASASAGASATVVALAKAAQSRRRGWSRREGRSENTCASKVSTRAPRRQASDASPALTQV